ncbi:toll/interleukin-1 receptor domain-containing protein [Gimesia aquarii]|uniref:Regulatory protein AfsR n=1 Tax=Gimesia aquarii TaxID=2527964 RepID=A0A517X1J6_9PLAN|nr:toll/interleukin-1 receptor domain-containing protein [Gimesia aquarii]QDU11369.1 Regulatory protein AfsR [Gimesia aquarii]
MSHQMIKWDFFIAHAGSDKEIAKQFYDGLQNHSQVFLDSKSLILGDDWDIALSKAQKQSLITVVLISSKTGAAYYQREEIAAAIAYARKNPNGHRIIPIYLDDECRESNEIPYGLRLKHSLIISENCTIQTAISKLIEVLKFLKNVDKKISDQDLSSSSVAKNELLKVFDVPFRENPLFTGRDEELQKLRERLISGKKAALTQAIRGLGGIGKTQLAVKYAYLYQYEYEHVFWVQLSNKFSKSDEGSIAEETEPKLQIVNSYVELCQKLRVPFDDSQPQTAIYAFQQWMEQNPNWLLIFDNADDPKLLKSFLPPQPQGHIILTSRAHTFDSLGILKPIEVEKLPLNEATDFLIERIARELEDSEKDFAEQLAKELDGLPLALEQAGAYIHESSLTFKRYLENYQRSKLDLLAKQKPVLGEYPKSVQTTWSMNFEAIRQQSEATADLLRFSAFLAPDAIPHELIAEGASFLGDSIHKFIRQFEDPMLAVVELLQPLANYSLINLAPGEEEFSIHRLVQEVMKAEVRSENEEQKWIVRVVNAMNAIYPHPDFSNWSTCRRFTLQCLVATGYIEQLKIETEYSGELLCKYGRFLCDIGEYLEANSLFLQALEICHSVLEEDHPLFGTSLNDLASTYMIQGRFTDAKPLLLQAIKIRRSVFGENHTSYAQSIHDLAYLYFCQKRCVDAEELYLQAIDIYRSVLGENHHYFAASLHNLARVYISQKRYAEAEQFFLQAMEIRRTALGERHPDFALSLNDLAVYYKSQGRFSDAEELYLQAKDIYQTVLGITHPHFAVTINNLANLFMDQGRYDEAAQNYLQTINILKLTFGPEHPDTKIVIKNYEQLKEKQSGCDKQAQ